VPSFQKPETFLFFECKIVRFAYRSVVLLNLDSHPTGRHFLQIPGPSPVPDRVLRAISLPTIDHRGPEFGELGLRVLRDIRKVFKTEQPVVMYPSSGTGAWEAALSNVMNPGDRVLMYETGHFAALWCKVAGRLGLDAEVMAYEGTDTVLPEAPGWRRGVQADRIEARLRQDTHHRIKAVCVVHNETSTGVTSDIAAVRAAIDAAHHPALLLVDTISGLAAADYRHDEWRVDVAIGGSQKGLMLPPGLGFNALSGRALDAMRTSSMPRSFWSWEEMLAANKDGYFPYTPSTNLMYGLAEALDMLMAEGLEHVFARHQRWARGVRAAVQAWGLPLLCADERLHSPILTGIVMPPGVDADALRASIHRRFDLSLGAGLGKVKGRIFRMGHLGDSNDLTLLAMVAGVQMGLKLGGVHLAGNGMDAAMQYFADHALDDASAGAEQ
jgi:alanine-glyoxylate transaminase/serine-glyoxylate transaminase/serine-pyruvate transaminase